MKAAVCREFGAPLQVEEVQLADPGPGEVEVKLGATAVCHSDISYAEGSWGGDLPAVYGHEAAGVVSRTGAGVTSVSAGDRVVVTLIRSCGSCDGCRQGQPVTCDATFPLDERSPLSDAAGRPIAHDMRTAAFAEYALVESTQLVRIPPDLPLDVASLLACGVITGYGGVANTAKVAPGSHVAVLGCGGVGLNGVQAAQLAGTESVSSSGSTRRSRRSGPARRCET